MDFFDDFNVEDNEFVNVLRERYDVELSEEPEYLFYSGFGYKHLDYQCVRIFFTGECDVPNFNECDYAIGFDRLDFCDRYMRIPLYMLFQYRQDFLSLNERGTFTPSDLKEKVGFCNFVYSNCFAQDRRTQMFELLSKYKQVDSGGRYRNNIGGAVKDKRAFQKKYKFTIAFENTSYNGYCTEKLTEAFAAGTIPIYYGDPRVGEDFDEHSFINCHRYRSLEEAVEVVKKIDQDDTLFVEMMNVKPVKVTYQPLGKFLYHIIEQEYSEAFRRSFSIPARSHEAMLKRHRFFEERIYKYLKKAKNQWDRFRTGTMLTSRRTK